VLTLLVVRFWVAGRYPWLDPTLTGLVAAALGLLRDSQRSPTFVAAGLQACPEFSPSMKTHRIAVIAGDGIGKEVIPAGIQVLKVAAEHDGFSWISPTSPGAATTTSKRGGCSTPTGATSS
jgi:hypothetical protein